MTGGHGVHPARLRLVAGPTSTTTSSPRTTSPTRRTRSSSAAASRATTSACTTTSCTASACSSGTRHPGTRTARCATTSSSTAGLRINKFEQVTQERNLVLARGERRARRGRVRSCGPTGMIPGGPTWPCSTGRRRPEVEVDAGRVPQGRRVVPPAGPAGRLRQAGAGRHGRRSADPRADGRGVRRVRPDEVPESEGAWAMNRRETVHLAGGPAPGLRWSGRGGRAEGRAVVLEEPINGRGRGPSGRSRRGRPACWPGRRAGGPSTWSPTARPSTAGRPPITTRRAAGMIRPPIPARTGRSGPSCSCSGPVHGGRVRGPRRAGQPAPRRRDRRRLAGAALARAGGEPRPVPGADRPVRQPRRPGAVPVRQLGGGGPGDLRARRDGDPARRLELRLAGRQARPPDARGGGRHARGLLQRRRRQPDARRVVRADGGRDAGVLQAGAGGGARLHRVAALPCVSRPRSSRRRTYPAR